MQREPTDVTASRSPADGEVVLRVRRGDVAAYRILLERYQTPLLRAVTRWLGVTATELDAEDVTQEAFVRAYEGLPGLTDVDRFGPWLYRIARSYCVDLQRRREVERRALATRHEKERRRRLDAVEPLLDELLALPTESFVLLHMRYYEGMTYEEIAARLEWSFSRVDHGIRRARDELRKALESESRDAVRM